MSTLTIDDVLGVEYPGQPEWSADGSHLAAPVHADGETHLRIASVDA
ncbi:MAG: hypothetical protein A07HR67_01295, partial [uncultured archaeon A07HR67]